MDFFAYSPLLPQLIQKGLDMQGRAPGEVERKLQLGLKVVDFTDHQYLWLPRIGSFWCGDTTPAAAGQASAVLLTTDATSKKLYRLRRLFLSSSQAGVTEQVRFGLITALGVIPAITAPVVRNGLPRDGRMLGAAESSCQVVHGTTAGGFGNGVPGIILPVGLRPTVIELNLTLGPMNAFMVSGIANNQPFIWILEWEEREALTTELS